jgi:uncharacterized membrane protein YphA (DoxX/SURF4 family)
MLITHETVLTFTFRVILGILFFFQGYDKVFRVKISNVIKTLELEMNNYKMPKPLLVFSAVYSSYIEFLGGLLLITGFLTKYVLYAIGLDLIMVVIAFSLIKPLWDMTLVFPRLILWGVVMVIPEAFNTLSVDYLILK